MFVTTYGSNATAITRYSTIYGDINTVNVSSISAAQSIYINTFLHAVGQYIGGGSIFLARGTDGSIGSATSYGWPTPYILLSAIASTTTVSYSGCPSGLQEVPTNVLAGQSCGCALAGEFFDRTPTPLSGVSSTEVPLPSNFYVPIPSIDFNMSQLNSGPFDSFAALNVIDLKSWLLKQPWASTLFPNLERCTMIDAPQGPPGVKFRFMLLRRRSQLPPKRSAHQLLSLWNSAARMLCQVQILIQFRLRLSRPLQFPLQVPLQVSLQVPLQVKFLIQREAQTCLAKRPLANTIVLSSTATVALPSAAMNTLPSPPPSRFQEPQCP